MNDWARTWRTWPDHSEYVAERTFHLVERTLFPEGADFSILHSSISNMERIGAIEWSELGERPSAAFPSLAEAALLKGNKIEAIKIVREERGVDLKGAKDIVEQHVAAHPGLQMQIEQRSGHVPARVSPLADGSDYHRGIGLLLCVG